MSEQIAPPSSQDSLLQGQSRLLEMVAKGLPLADTLAELMRLIESQSPGVYCSVLLLDEDGVHIRPGAGPSLPAEYMAALDGYAIGPAVGSCGTAMFRKAPVIVTDIETDPLWAPYKHLVAPHGLRASWSTPIFLNREQVLGTFAMYYKEVRNPGPVEWGLIAVATHIAGIAIERKRREAELERHRFHLEELVAARTAELSAAKARVEASNLALSQSNQDLAAALRSLSETQEELVRRDKLAALGALVAGVAHELNTPIGNSLVVASTLGDLARQFAGNYSSGLTRAMVEDFIRNASAAGDLLQQNLQRAAGLVASFKQVAVEQASSQRRKFALTHLVPTLQASYRHTGASIAHAFAPDLVMDSYPGPLGEVIVTLVNNALIHAYGGQPGEVQVSARDAGAGQVEISVQDQGAGIAPANLKRIFDPFFTTTLGQGSSGLGLYIAHNIVTGILGGHIQASSEPERGSRFTLVLPRVAPLFQQNGEEARGSDTLPPAS
jgi:signal transduction histidine kinase